MGNQLLGAAMSHYEVLLDELNQAFCVRVALVLEVKAIWCLNNTNCFFVGVVLQNQLLQKQKCALVCHSLAHLNLTVPSVRCPGLLTIVALLVLYDELYVEGLLEQSAALNFLLDGKFNFDSATMRLCPNKFSVDKFNFLKSFHLLEAKSEQVRRLKLILAPWWAVIAIALAAVIELALFGYTFSDVYL